jgi:hypothetical protein
MQSITTTSTTTMLSIDSNVPSTTIDQSDPIPVVKKPQGQDGLLEQCDTVKPPALESPRSQATEETFTDESSLCSDEDDQYYSSNEDSDDDENEDERERDGRPHPRCRLAMLYSWLAHLGWALWKRLRTFPKLLTRQNSDTCEREREESNSNTAGKLETDGSDDCSAEEADEADDGLTPELRRKIEEIEELERDLIRHPGSSLPQRTKESDEEFEKWMNSPIEEVEPMTKEEYEEANIVSMARLLKHAYPDSASCSQVSGRSEGEENDWLTPALRREAKQMNESLFKRVEMKVLKRFELNSNTAGKLETDGADDCSAAKEDDEADDEADDGLTPELRRKIEEIEELERDLIRHPGSSLPQRTKESDEEFQRWMNSPIEEVEPMTKEEREERKEASIVNMAKMLKHRADGRLEGEENDWLTPALRREAEQLHKSIFKKWYY